jgi:hypothetical protein
MKKLNVKDQEILNVINEDIKKSPSNKSAITNGKISLLLGGYSYPQVRDKVVRLNKLGYIDCEHDLWVGNTYYPRLISKGKFE